MYHVIIYHPIKYLFGICLYSMLTNTLNLQILAQNDIFFLYSLFWRPFSITIATVKVKSICNKNTWIIHLIKQSKYNVVKLLLIIGFLVGGGRKKTGLTNVPLCYRFPPHQHRNIFSLEDALIKCGLAIAGWVWWFKRYIPGCRDMSWLSST